MRQMTPIFGERCIRDRGSIEDHASNLPLAVTKCRQMVDNLRYLVGMEALFASQAVDLRKSDGNGDYVHLGKGTQKAYDVDVYKRQRRSHRAG